MTSGNGEPGRGPARSVRVDGPRGGGPDAAGPRHSGRRFVVVALLGLVLVAGGLALAFRAWRAAYRRRAAFGAGSVAPVVLPLAATVPPGVEPADWAHAVDRLRDLVVAVTGANLLGRAQMEALRAELADRVARARPATAAAVLVRTWDELEDRAGPVVTQSRRFGLAAAIRPLAHKVPPGIAAGDWAWAVADTRALLVDLADSGRIAPEALPDFRAAWSARAAVARPDAASDALAGVWDDVAARARAVLADRPRPAAIR